MSEPTLLQFRRSPVLHIDAASDGIALCGKSGPDAQARGLLRDHTPFDKPVCRQCQKRLDPSFEDLAREGGI